MSNGIREALWAVYGKMNYLSDNNEAKRCPPTSVGGGYRFGFQAESISMMHGRLQVKTLQASLSYNWIVLKASLPNPGFQVGTTVQYLYPAPLGCCDKRSCHIQLPIAWKQNSFPHISLLVRLCDAHNALRPFQENYIAFTL